MVKPYLLQVLKELALLGGIENKIEISSLELARQIQTSQQTASRQLLELDAEGLIIREMGIKKQRIQLTDAGVDLLKQEYVEYQQIFALPDTIHFTGRVVSGLGEGRYYTEQRGYVEQFKEKLGFVPYPGTFNVEIEQVEKNKLKLLRSYKGLMIEQFTAKHRTFGGVQCFHATIEHHQVVLVLPLRSHYSKILEFISPEHLRKALNVTDGDPITIVIQL
jgi:riboflavin kinase